MESVASIVLVYVLIFFSVFFDCCADWVRNYFDSLREVVEEGFSFTAD